MAYQVRLSPELGLAWISELDLMELGKNVFVTLFGGKSSR